MMTTSTSPATTWGLIKSDDLINSFGHLTGFQSSTAPLHRQRGDKQSEELAPLSLLISLTTNTFSATRGLTMFND